MKYIYTPTLRVSRPFSKYLSSKLFTTIQISYYNGTFFFAWYIVMDKSEKIFLISTSNFQTHSILK